MKKNEYDFSPIKGECPVCEHLGWCQIDESESVVMCRREAKGAFETKKDRNGVPYHLHQIKESNDQPSDDAGPRKKKPGPLPPAADVETRNNVYLALIDALGLELIHRDDLTRRGLSDADIDRRQYRSLPNRAAPRLAATLAERFGRDVLLSVPGFIVGGKGGLTMGCMPGLLIPVRDLAGRIITLISRPNKRMEGVKYLWLSGARHGFPSPGTPPHVPLGCERADLWRLTEGQLKADIATARSGIPTIGAAGVAWRPCIAVLTEAGCKTVRLAFDADAVTNKLVAAPLWACANALHRAGFDVEYERWTIRDGKGIDDILASGKTTEVLTGCAALDAIREAAEAAGADVDDDGSDEHAGPTPSDDRAESRESQAEALLRLASPCSLSHTDDGRTFARMPVDDHEENHEIRSAGFKRWLVRAFYKENGRPPSSDAMQGALGVLESQAHYDGPIEPVYVRVAPGGGGEVFLDLGDDSWSAVRVGPDGWELVERPLVRFRRPAGLRPLPTPLRAGTIREHLRRFVNVVDADWLLVVAWITAAMLPAGPYPVLALSGEQGSAKSTLARLLRLLIDPHVSPLRCEPKESRDLMIAAKNGWVVVIDNLSGLLGWLSDALCRLATGGGFSTRQLYTDSDEVFFDAQRPVILTGIEDFVSRGDLSDRCVSLHLPTIPETNRRTEAEFWAEFDEARAAIFGALLSAVAAGLRVRPDVQLSRLPRMADFAVWGEAVCQALGEKPGAFLEVYDRNRRDANEAILDDSLVASAVKSFMASRPVWEGTSSKLMDELNELHPDYAAIKVKGRWPKSPRGLSGHLKRLTPALRTVSVEVAFSRLPEERRLTLSSVKPVDQPSQPYPEASELLPSNGDHDASDGRMTGERRSMCHQPPRANALDTATCDGHNANDGHDAKIPPLTGNGRERFIL
jgi:hypothetical protein